MNLELIAACLVGVVIGLSCYAVYEIANAEDDPNDLPPFAV